MREVTIRLAEGELDLLIEALDSHEYWQVSEPNERNNGPQFQDERSDGVHFRFRVSEEVARREP